MILASHIIISAYGFWLPNDPRGSWSDLVRSWELYMGYGAATKVNHTRSVARVPHDRRLRLQAKTALGYPPVRFTGIQAVAISQGFASQVQRSGFAIHACSILPQHTHLVIARHRYHVEQVVNLLKGSASRVLAEQGMHPFQDERLPDGSRPSMWGVGLWKVFLDSPEGVRRAVGYVERNPLHEGKRPQRWSFCAPYEGGSVCVREPGPAGRR